MDSDFNPSKKRDKKSIIDQLDEFIDDSELEDYNNSASYNRFLPTTNITDDSYILPSFSKKKRKDSFSDVMTDEYFEDLMASSDIKIKKHGKGTYDDLFGDKKKKKKKKKKKNELTDYKKEFEPEAALLRNLLIEQNRYVDSLQREYDYMANHKSSSRGINKNMTDLMDNITQARNLSMQLVDKHVNLKKTIADLSMKERKERAGTLGEGDNLADFASSYLKQMISDRAQYINGTGSAEIGNYTSEEMANFITENIGESDRRIEADKYLEYENMNVTIYLHINSQDEGDYYYEAVAEDGTILDDYPLPLKETKFNINRSTDIATDTYGVKYQIIWD